MKEAQIQCQCGKLKGTVKMQAPVGRHLFCYCDDCQCFAHNMKDPLSILDENGGTEIYQTTPSNVKITEGKEHLQCFRLSPKGTLRWYASCCQSPLANTLPTGKVAFIGLFAQRFVQPGELPPTQARVHGKFAQGPANRDIHSTVSPGFLLKTLFSLASQTLLGRNRPHPLFDDVTGNPIVEPTIVSKEERMELRKKANVL